MSMKGIIGAGIRVPNTPKMETFKKGLSFAWVLNGHLVRLFIVFIWSEEIGANETKALLAPE